MIIIKLIENSYTRNYFSRTHKNYSKLPPKVFVQEIQGCI